MVATMATRGLDRPARCRRRAARDTPYRFLCKSTAAAISAHRVRERGPCAQPVRPRRRAAPARAGRPRPRAAAVRGGARAGRPRPARAQHGAHRAARGRQDRAAQRVPVDGDPAAVGHRQDRGPARPVDPPAGRRRAAHGGPRAGAPAPRARPDRGSSSACSRRSRCATRAAAARAVHRWQPGIDVPAARGRADSGDLEIDLIELFADAASVATDLGVGIALFVDEMQDVPADDVSALCAACHELSQSGGPLIVVGAGLPHLPAVLSASKSYSERLFRYVAASTGSTGRPPTWRCSPRPSARTSTFTPDALDALYEATDGYPYFVQAYGKVDLGRRAGAARSPPTTSRSPRPRRRASWPSASSAAGTSGPPRPSATTCGHGRARRRPGADRDGRRRARPQAVQPVPGPRRPDQEGPRSTAPSAAWSAFTVPHFGQFLRAQPV